MLQCEALRRLPTTAELITEKYGNRVTTFNGDETPIDTLRKLGIDSRKFPGWLSREAGFDRGRFTIAADLMSRGALLEEPAKDAGAAWKSGSLGARLRAISVSGQGSVPRSCRSLFRRQRVCPRCL